MRTRSRIEHNFANSENLLSLAKESLPQGIRRVWVMGILSWIVIGLLVGWFANRLMGGSYSFVGEMTSGIAGAVSSGFITSYLLNFRSPFMNIHWASIFVAALGALALVAVLRRTVRSRS